MRLFFPEVIRLPLSRYEPLLGPERMRQIEHRVAQLRELLLGRVVWNVSSTAVGGGVAEMVRVLLSYARGAGVDARWVVMQAPPEFFRVTKRLHNALHGVRGDGSPLGEDERRLYEQVVVEDASELLPLIRPRDVVVVHDPQPAGMIPMIVARGAYCIWRCHIGADEENEETQLGWHFLLPYLREASAYVFSRPQFVPPELDRNRASIIAPSIDPFSAKNQILHDEAIRAILGCANLVDTLPDCTHATYLREDGTPSRVDRPAEVVRVGGPPPLSTPLVVQVSRWDQLKDPIGLVQSFALIDAQRLRGAVLVVAGPNTRAVADDPEGATVYARTVDAWRALPEALRARVQLALLPTEVIDENAAIVNALQRHATIIVQKSLREGFGLTVTEAMWKGRPLVASAVGGIQDQIEDGVEGLLLRDPSDLEACAQAIARLLGNPELCRKMGEAGHAKVRDHYLGIDSLLRYGALIERLETRTQPAATL